MSRWNFSKSCKRQASCDNVSEAFGKILARMYGVLESGEERKVDWLRPWPT